MTDGSRSVVWDRTQLPFGSEDTLTGSAANDNRFPDQREEAEIGLCYNFFRDYDSTRGRYLSPGRVFQNSNQIIEKMVHSTRFERVISVFGESFYALI